MKKLLCLLTLLVSLFVSPPASVAQVYDTLTIAPVVPTDPDFGPLFTVCAGQLGGHRLNVDYTYSLFPTSWTMLARWSPTRDYQTVCLYVPGSFPQFFIRAQNWPGEEGPALARRPVAPATAKIQVRHKANHSLLVEHSDSEAGPWHPLVEVTAPRRSQPFEFETSLPVKKFVRSVQRPARP